MKKTRKQVEKIVNESENLKDALGNLENNGYCVGYINDFDTLKYFSIEQLQNDDFNLAMHILNAIYEYGDDVLYNYNPDMGTLESVTTIENFDELIDVVCDIEGL